jgi:RNA polymerase sigma-70 factor (ECF subfamily)
MDTTAIWETFRRELRRFIRRRVRSDADADDILQHVLLNIHRSLRRSAPPRHLRGWLFQVTRNAIADHLRPRSARETIDSATAALVAASDGEQPLDRTARALSKCLRPMLKNLPAHYRDAVTWIELDGLTQQDAAARAGISLSGMKSRVQRGREQLRAALLVCCQVELDRTSQPIDFTPRPGHACERHRCGT